MAHELADHVAAGRAMYLETPIGYVIASINRQADNDCLELYLWLGVGTCREAFRIVEPSLIEFARSYDCRQIRFWPRRKGWARLLRADWRVNAEGYMVKEI